MPSPPRRAEVSQGSALGSARLVGNTAHNEYDRYLTIESPAGTILESWEQLQPALPRLAFMARDIFAIPASGAGVERQFSKSGRIDT